MELVAFIGFLLAAPWPFWRLAVSTPVRQRRRDQFVLLAVLVVYGIAVVAIAFAWPAALPILTAIAAVIVGAFWWRSRPDHGRRANLPPGRIRPHPLGPYDDVDYLLREAERYGPIFKIGATFPIPTLTPIICVVGHERGIELLRDHESSLEVYPPFPASRFIPRGFLRSMSTADHDRFAPILRQAATRSADAGFETAVARAARDRLARLAAASAQAGAAGIDPRPELSGFVWDVLARLHFGIEPGTEESAWLAERYRAMNVASIVSWLPQRDNQRRWTTLVDDLGRYAGPIRSDPSPGRPSVLREALALAGDAGLDTPVDRETIVGNVVQMQESGTQDLSALLTWVVKYLGDHPAWLERARADPNGSLPERIIRESLRLEQSEFLNRRVTSDLAFGGYRFPAGWRVRICIREGHRSAALFDRPTEFDPDRWLGRAHPPTEYAPFGLVRHHCLAARLTQRVGGILVDELARGYRLTITHDGPRRHDRFHWRPSHRLRVRLEPLTVA